MAETLTWSQTGYWRDSLTLWSHCVAVTRDNMIARINLGIALQTAGQIDEAMEPYREVLRLIPIKTSANLDLGAGVAYDRASDEATNCFIRALRRRPDWSASPSKSGTCPL